MRPDEEAGRSNAGTSHILFRVRDSNLNTCKKHSGVLMKRSSHDRTFRKKWHRRWFSLTNSTLSYSEKDNV